MNIQAEKLSVLQQILNTDDIGIINDIKSLLSSREIDWFDSLSKAQQDDVMQGIEQLDNGDVFSHDEAKKRFGFRE